MAASEKPMRTRLSVAAPFSTTALDWTKAGAGATLMATSGGTLTFGTVTSGGKQTLEAAGAVAGPAAGKRGSFMA